MKKYNLFLTALLTLFVVSSCINDDENGVEPNNDDIRFTSSIEGAKASRMVGSAWEANDAIGIFMTNTGVPLSTTSIANGADNREYFTDGSSAFTAKGDDQKISFPKTAVDFVAYYPFTAGIVDYKYEVSVLNQSSLSAIDLLYSNNAKNASQSDPNVNLVFNHKLTKIILNIQKGVGISDLTDLSVAITGMNTLASLSLATGMLTPDDASKQKIEVTSANTATSSKAEAIVLPTATIGSATVAFTVSGETYFWSIPSNTVLQSGKKYTYDVVLQSSGVITLVPNGTIEDWIDEPTENIVVDREGTEHNPFTISRATQNIGENAKWVTGYIVGSTPATRTGTDVDSNILLAEKADETNPENFFAVDISDNPDVKAALNLVSNPEMLGKLVKVQGNITASVLGTNVGLKSVTAQIGGIEVVIERVEFFREGFGTHEATRIKIADYTKWDMPSPVTYSDEYSITEVRYTTTWDSHIWFESSKDCSFKIEGFSSEYTKMQLSYEITANKAGVNSEVIVKADGVKLNIPVVNIPVANAYHTLSIDIPDNTTTLYFFCKGELNTNGFRVNNIVLAGVKR